MDTMDIMGSGATDISILSLVYLLVFLIPIIWINRKLVLGVNKDMLTSITRMCVQLSFVGLYLKYLFKFDSALLNTVYLLIMMSITCHSVLKSSNLKFKALFFPVFSALFVPFTIILFFFNAVVVQIDNLFDAKYLIPIGGMLLGNCLRSIIIGLSQFYSGIKKEEKVYINSISLFGSRFIALKPFFKESFIAAITPTIASMATIGIVALPGMMTGQILGGSIPMIAIKYQIAIMFSIFYNEYFSTILAVLFSLNVGFNKLDMLNHTIFNNKN
jgi:UDP-glucose/iron transport system permease protein